MTTLFEALCRASVFGLAALFVVLCAQWLLGRKVPASWRAWVWRVALLQSVFALLPLAPVRWQVLAPPAPVISAPPPADASEFSIPEDSALPPDSALDDQRAPVLSAPILGTPPAKIAPLPKPTSTPLDWGALLLPIYVAGLAFRCAQLAHGALQLRRVLRACTPVGDARLLARCQTLAARLKLKSAPHLLQAASGSPFVTGIFRPRIVLPRALCDGDAIQLDAVMAHELAHCKRRDLAWSALLWLAQTLLWFHPLGWAARRFHGLETECACDELALQIAPIAPQSYGALLLYSMNKFTFHTPLAAGTCDGLFAFKTRLLRLNNAPKSPRKTAKLAFVLALLLSCGALVPLKLVARAGDAALGAPVEITRTKPQTLVAARAVVQGVVTSKVTGKPVAGVPMILFAPSANKIPADAPLYQKTVTDARGYFRFNTAGGGNHTLGVDGSVEIVENKISFLAYQIYDFKLNNGMKRDFKLQLVQTDLMTRQIANSRIPSNAVVQGVILSKQTQQPLAGITMMLLAGASSQMPVAITPPVLDQAQQTVTDARGYFRFKTKGGPHGLGFNASIVADSTQNISYRAETIRVFDLRNGQKRDFKIELKNSPEKAHRRGDPATAPVAATKAGSASGQIVDENKRPLAGATAILYRIFDKGSPIGTETRSDANGRFRFEGLQPGAQFSINANKKGYAYSGSPVQIAEVGKNATFTVSLQAATAALRGVVIGEDGQPARNYTVQITHAFVADTKTDAQGRFLFPQALPGQNAVRVLTPKGDNGWGTFNVSGGEQNAKIRLTKSVSDARFPHVRPTPKTMSDVTRALIGKTAPEIKAARWINGKTKSLQSLRGKVVLLVFDNFAGDNQNPWNDSARFTSGRLEIVGVQVNSGALIIPAARMNEVAANAAFPIALDAERDDGNSLGGQTFSEYGMGVTGKHGYAIIGRDGKIVEAGDSLLNAFKFADRQ